MISQANLFNSDKVFLDKKTLRSSASTAGRKVFKSQVLIFFLKSGGKLLEFCQEILKKSSLPPIFAGLPVKSVTIFLFIVFLAIVPNSQVQSSKHSSIIVDLSQKENNINFILLLNVLLLPLVLMFINQYRRRKFFVLKFEIFLIIFLILAQISAILGMDVSASFIWFLKLLLGFSIYLLFSRLELGEKYLKLILYAFLLTTFLEGFLAGAQFIKGNLIGLPFEGTNMFISSGIIGFRAMGTFSHTNELSAYLAMFLSIFTAVIFSRKIFKKTIFYIAIALCLITSLISYSRWGLATDLFAFLFTIILLKKIINFQLKTITSSISIRIFVIIFLLIIGWFVFVNQLILKRFMEFTSGDVSLSVRKELITQAVDIIGENPLVGIGGGNFLIYFTNYDFTDTNVSRRFLFPVHNFVLLLVTENGFGAPLVLLLAMLGIAWFFFSRIKHLSFENKLLAIGLFASVATFFFNGLWALRSFEDRVGFLFFLMLGLLVNILSGPNYYEKSAKS